MQIVILAGGLGSRLWPLSQENYPKQFLTLGGKFSLLQETVLRFLDQYPLLIVTNVAYEAIVKKQLGVIGAGQVPVLAEPARKNTAPAIALALRFLEERGQQNEPLLILPSDHLLAPKELFFEYLTRIEPTVLKGKLVIFGIQPTKAETGFGYMKIGKSFDEFCYNVDEFVEKPDLKRAESFIQNPLYYWNSGMLASTFDFLWQMFQKHLPKLAQLKKWSWEECLKNFEHLPNISIDYGVIEKSDAIVSCPLHIKWSDLGSWDLVYEALEKDAEQNVKIGDATLIGTKKSLFSSHKKKIVAVGVEDLLVVETEDTIFVGKKGEAHRLSNMVFKK